VWWAVLRRARNFAFARPIREVLFTAISREDRYKAKNFIDTVIYRTGDQIASWSYLALTAIGLTLTSVLTVVAIPRSVAWLGLGFWLVHKRNRLVRS
jgi:AAA family ATP:ADP antiporter